MDLPLAQIERIMRNAGAERITEGAAMALQRSAQEIVEEVADDAVRIAREEGHDSVEIGDVRRALEV